MYLRKFKWHHLTEKVAYEARVREQRALQKLRNREFDKELDSLRNSHLKIHTDRARACMFWMSDYYAILLHLMTIRASIVASLKIRN